MKRALVLIFSMLLVTGAVYLVSAQEETKTNVLDDFVSEIKKTKGKDVQEKVEMIPFSGKLVNHGSSIRIPGTFYTSLVNLRYSDNGAGEFYLETRGGMTPYTDAEPNQKEIIDLFPFETDTERHIIAASADANGTTLYPIEGGAFGTALTHIAGATTIPITHAVVRDTLSVGGTTGVVLYSGVSVYPTALMVEYVNGVFSDRYDWIHSDSSNVVTSGNTVHVGYSRPFDRWQSNQSSSMDSMRSGVTETMKSGKMRFWLSYVTTGNSTVYKPKIESLARELGSAWDGQNWAYPIVAGFQKTGNSPFQDYSLHLQDNSEETYMDVSQWQSGGSIFGGWTYRPREIHVYLPEEYKNTVLSSVSPYYWNGTNWTVIPGFEDGTSSGSVALARSGVYGIPKITDWKTRKIENIPYDVYAVLWKVNTTISNYVRIHKMVAVPDYDSPSSVGKYTMTAASHNRHILANGRDRTKLLISAENQPDCFVGEDSASEDEPIEVGKREDFIWVGPVGEETLVMKQSENFTLIGVNPNTWELKPLYGTKPAVSTKSVQVIEVQGTRFVLYAGRDGVYSIPTMEGINSDDIRAYFEPGNALEFSYAQLKNSTSWHDQTFNEYHLIVGNKELVLNLKAKRWSVFDRGYDVSCGTYFVSSDNQRYHLGGGKTGGTVYTLESGATDSGVIIVGDLTRPASVLAKNYAGKSEIRAVALRYQLLDDATAIGGATAYLTSSLSPNATTYQAAFDLPDEGWQYLNLLNWRNGVKGYTHKRRYRIPGRVALLGEVVWSREAEWPRDPVPTTVVTTTTTTTTTTTSLPPASGIVFHSDGTMFHDDGEVFHDF